MIKHLIGTKVWSNGINYHNKKRFASGVIDKTFRKRFKGKIPKCDIVWLEVDKESLFVLTLDEMQGLAMLLTETVWKTMPKIKRN